jgi:hypothetical protein
MQPKLGILKKKLNHGCQRVPFAQAMGMSRILEGWCSEHLRRSQCRARMSSLVSTPLQEGQRKMSCSARTPSLGIARSSFMVSPHERHTSVGVLSETGGGRSIEGVEGV